MSVFITARSTILGTRVPCFTDRRTGRVNPKSCEFASVQPPQSMTQVSLQFFYFYSCQFTFLSLVGATVNLCVKQLTLTNKPEETANLVTSNPGCCGDKCVSIVTYMFPLSHLGLPRQVALGASEGATV